MNDHDAAQTEESGAVWGDVSPEERAALDEVFGPEEADEWTESGSTPSPWYW